MSSNLLAQRWIDLNAPYARNNFYGLEERNRVYFRVGDNPILLTAPHAVHHYRSQAQPDKPSDEYTGGLCDLLGKSIGATTLTAASFFDPWDTWLKRDDAFKDALTAAVAKKMFVVDLHGMNNKHGMDVCLGLGPHPSERLQQVASELQRALAPLTVTIDQPFSAQLPHTITSYVQLLGGDALQIEIAKRWRDPYEDPVAATLFAERMVGVLRAI